MERDDACVQRNFKGHIVADNLKYDGISMFGDIKFSNGLLSSVHCQHASGKVKNYLKNNVKKGTRMYVQGNFDFESITVLYLNNCTF